MSKKTAAATIVEQPEQVILPAPMVELSPVQSYTAQVRNATEALDQNQQQQAELHERREATRRRLESLDEILAASHNRCNSLQQHISDQEHILLQSRTQAALARGTGYAQEQQADERLHQAEQTLSALQAQLDQARTEQAKDEPKLLAQKQAVQAQLEQDEADLASLEQLRTHLQAARAEAHNLLGLAIKDEIVGGIAELQEIEGNLESALAETRAELIEAQHFIIADRLQDWPELKRQVQKEYGPSPRDKDTATRRILVSLIGYLRALEGAGSLRGTFTPTRAIGSQQMLSLLTFDTYSMQMVLNPRSADSSRIDFLSSRRRAIETWLEDHLEDLENGYFF